MKRRDFIKTTTAAGVAHASGFQVSCNRSFETASTTTSLLPSGQSDS
ncbi:MAG: twin-arginine translocation signal domain-containing protein [Fuerstiella sp.]|nr:twin-arginine translocation signal domain-containing protein [Fuerstiella sp.]